MDKLYHTGYPRKKALILKYCALEPYSGTHSMMIKIIKYWFILISLQNVDDIWNNMGRTVNCAINQATGGADVDVDIPNPSDFNSNLPFKLFAHGFGDTLVDVKKDLFVHSKLKIAQLIISFLTFHFYSLKSGWMQRYNKNVNVVLIDWSSLAKVGQVRY